MNRAVAILAVTFAALALERPAIGETSARDAALSKASLVYIATVRKDGNQSTAAPVWFTTTPDHHVLIQTGPTTWKAKRVGRGSPMIVWIGEKTGPAFIAKAAITREPALLQRIVEDFPKRYVEARLGFHKPSLESFEKGDRVAIEIIPVRDLPKGFASSPGTPAPSVAEGKR
jgi:hypothetical protein